MTEERKLVTVLFADIVGSTATTAAHDPELVRSTLASTFSQLREILIAHGGTVEKFIGDAVMAVFGIPATHDDDAERAVRSAFALREAVATRGDLALSLRIGVSTGEVVAGAGAATELLVTGVPVNTASRLQQAASVGEILVGALTRRLTESAIQYGQPRTVEAKGIGMIEASAAQVVLSEVPTARRGLEGLRAPLIGRDEELRLLVDAQARASVDRAYVVTVFGPAGSGKSRLTAEFLSRIAPGRARVGRCLPYGKGITFYPLRMILTTDVGIDREDARDAALDKLRRSVVGAVAADEADAVTARLAVLAGLSEPTEALLEVTASQVEVELRWGLRRYLEGRIAAVDVLVFEDIHWAEPRLLDMIEDLGQRLRAPLLLLCLARPEFLDERPGWGGGRTNAAAITLEPLTSTETRELVGALLTVDDLPDAVREEVVVRAEGNPLYVEEFLRMLIDAGAIAPENGRWVTTRQLASLAIPPTLQGLIAARVDRLRPETKRVLQCAAVVGRVFVAGAMEALANGTAVPAALEDALERDLITEGEGRGSRRLYRFRHVLIRDVIYTSVPKGERSRLHDRYGRWLEASLGENRADLLDLLTYHAEQAFLLASEIRAPEAAQLGSRAFDLLLAAATRARRQADRITALSLYERAVRAAEASGQRGPRWLEARGYALFSRRAIQPSPEQIPDMDALLVEAREAGPSEVLVHLLTSRGWAGLAMGEWPLDRAHAMFAEARRAAEAVADPELIADALVSSRSPDVDGLAEDERVMREAYEYMQQTGARRLIATVLRRISWATINRGDFAGSQRLIDQMGPRAEASGSKRQRWEVVQTATQMSVEIGDLAEGLRGARLSAELSQEVGIAGDIAWSQWLVGDALARSGQLEAARDLLRDALSTYERSLPGIAEFLRDRLVRVYLLMGDAATARATAEGARSLPLSAPWDRVNAHWTRALLHAAENADEAAEADFRAADGEAASSGLGLLAAEIRTDLASFLIARGRFGDARPMLEANLAFYDPVVARRMHEQMLDLLRRSEPASA